LDACAADFEPDHEAFVMDATTEDHVDAPVVSTPDAAPPDAPPVEASTFDAAPLDGGVCDVRIDAIPILASPHVADGTPVVYDSNPPSSGPHYNEWANFQEFAHPVDDRNLVHSLEHGAVLLLYNCDADAGGGLDGGAACDEVVTALRAVRDAFPDDPLCDPAIRVRIIIAPRPANDVAVAAAAWGNVYRADCVDSASLTAFVTEHYAKGPENFCAPGQVF
jgi:hypothetical protein